MSEVRPYGSWSSPISAAMTAAAGVGLGQVTVVGEVAWWVERRPSEAGRQVLVRGGPHEAPRDVTPPGFDVRTRVHEYGGGDYCLDGEVAICSRKEDQRLYRIAPGAEPVPITPEVDGRDRFADGRVWRGWWIGVRERHEGSTAAEVANELVAVPLDGSAPPRTIASGRDFYAAPRPSPDGSRLAFLAWDLPAMPWGGCELLVAPLGPDASLGEPALVAGRSSVESIWQPTWSPAGDLLFASDRSGWWNLERVAEGRPGGERAVLHAAEAEFGYPMWALGERSFAVLDDGRVACCYDRDGRTHVAILDPGSGELLDLDLPHDALGWGPSLDADGSAVVFVAGSATIPEQLVWLDLHARSIDVVRESLEVPVDPALCSTPEPIAFPTEGGRTAYGLYYPPTNPGFVAPSGERPPLVVRIHGGPTSAATRLFDLGVQYLTSRGFAVVDVNYGGSTGYGRAYRDRLRGAWGVVDVEDAVHAARFLVDRGLADPTRIVIRGGSAGGYTTLQALVSTDVFAAGTSLYGICDLEPLATGDTHKFESHYLESLVGPWPEAAERYRERSPIHHLDRLRTPLLVLHGAEDRVVPPSQAERIVEALRAAKVPHAYLLFDGEDHGFRRADTIARAREAELAFYAAVLGIDLADPPSALRIEGLGPKVRVDPGRSAPEAGSEAMGGSGP
ncbi:MAG: peptidase [Actinomycetota bacterium]|nr:MAG: peptidase [Actinomycetota bacterium]